MGSCSDVDLEERSIEDNLERRCTVCGAELTQREIEEARETAGPFLCSVHAAEELPAEAEPAQTDSDDGPELPPADAS